MDELGHLGLVDSSATKCPLYHFPMELMVAYYNGVFWSDDLYLIVDLATQCVCAM